MMGVSAQHNKIQVAIAAWAWPAYFSPEARMKGIRLQTTKWRRPPPECAPVQAKAAGLYMICTLAKHEAESAGFDDALMLDWRGQVSEATGANIFLNIDGALHTPDADCFLAGITRQTVIDLARQCGIDVIERAIMPDDLDKAMEVFVTGTAAEVTPVGEIDGHKYVVGEVTKQLMDAYDAVVRRKAAA
jgi:branched-chain amino acid aminotransferase